MQPDRVPLSPSDEHVELIPADGIDDTEHLVTAARSFAALFGVDRSHPGWHRDLRKALAQELRCEGLAVVHVHADNNYVTIDVFEVNRRRDVNHRTALTWGFPVQAILIREALKRARYD